MEPQNENSNASSPCWLIFFWHLLNLEENSCSIRESRGLFYVEQSRPSQGNNPDFHFNIDGNHCSLSSWLTLYLDADIDAINWIFANQYKSSIHDLMLGKEVCTYFDNMTLELWLLFSLLGAGRWYMWCHFTYWHGICQNISKYNSGRDSRNLNRNNKKFTEVWFGDWTQVWSRTLQTDRQLT